ncbi:hypothetical protein DOY81_010940 [Sarcophaga bullata]|nr:hypothetical protein DOY81_010940 [Sarcophaga bullata]
MPLIKNNTTTTATVDATATIPNENETTTTTTTTLIDEIATTITNKTTKNKNKQYQQQHQQQQQQQQRINDIIPLKITTRTTSAKRRKHYSNRKHKTSLAKSVPATPVQVNPLTTNHFVPSSPDFYDNEIDVDDDDDNDDDNNDDVLYMPPYSYPTCSLDMLNGDYDYENEFAYNPPPQLHIEHQQQQQLRNGHVEGQEEEQFREGLGDNHPLELRRDNDEDSSSMAMITPPPPYDTPYTKQKVLQPYCYPTQRYPQHQAAYTAPKAQRSHHGAHTRKYIFNNNREQFNISSSNGNSSSNSIQQQPQSSSLGSTITNAITPTKLSAAAAAMFAAPQMVQLNRKWSNLHRKRRRRNSSSGDSKELDKLVLQSVDWDENDIY